MVRFVGKAGVVQCVHVCFERLFRCVQDVLAGDLEGRREGEEGERRGGEGQKDVQTRGVSFTSKERTNTYTRISNFLPWTNKGCVTNN